MLILTRQIGKNIMIGDEVTISVLDITGSQVRLGVNAPKNIAVYRSEIYQRIQIEKAKEEGRNSNANENNRANF